MSILIDKEFESLIPPLSAEEFQQLEANCLRDGIRDALIVWEQDGNDILIDGHNRFRIVGKHPTIQFNIKRMQFADRDSAMLWIIRNQKGRRNLDKLTKIDLRLKEEKLVAKQANKGGRPKNGSAKPPKKSWEDSTEKRREDRKNETAYKVAKEIGISEDTYRKGKKILNSGNDELIQQVQSGKKTIHQGWTELKEKERKQIDMSAKAHLEKAEERHKDFAESKTVSIADVAQDRKDSAEIARSKYNEIYNAIKKVLFIGASNFDYSIISQKTMGETEIRRLHGEIEIAILTLTRIKNEIGG